MPHASPLIRETKLHIRRFQIPDDSNKEGKGLMGIGAVRKLSLRKINLFGIRFGQLFGHLQYNNRKQ